mmetsp:Transcript_17670/g.41493  ORF Transcript_17670/g.41493 Transcript_17670/m.41493 type:complete len:232 (+) Transcript_17670:1339-2034(+)
MSKIEGLACAHACSEEIVLGPVEGIHQDLSTEAPNYGDVHVQPHTEEWVSVQMRLKQLIAELGPQRGRNLREGLHVLFFDLFGLVEPLGGLTLHQVRGDFVDLVLPQETAQLGEFLRVVQFSHLIVYHAGRQEGHQCTAEYQPQNKAEDVEHPLNGIGTFIVNGAKRELGPTPVHAREVPVHPARFKEVNCIAFHDKLVHPPVASVAGCQAPNGKPSAGDEMKKPERGTKK